MAEEQNIDKLDGLSGWLILVGIGVVIDPLLTLAQMIPFYEGIMHEGWWEIFTAQEIGDLNPYWALLLSIEFIVLLAFFLAGIYLIFLFFKKKRSFPTLYIVISVSALISLFASTYLSGILLPEEPAFDDKTLVELFKSLLSTVIWCQYMWVSKRVKATFTR